MDDIVRAKRPLRIPVVLTHKETKALLGEMRGTPWLMASLLYGAGLRLMECARLRVKDVDFARREIRVRNGTGAEVSARPMGMRLAVGLSRNAALP
jgi:integrase